MTDLMHQIEAAGLHLISKDDQERLRNNILGHPHKEKQTINLPSSPPHSAIASLPQPPDTDVMTKEERRLTRNFDRGAPGDAAIFTEIKTPEQKQFARRRSQFYGEVFATRETNSSARERILKESIVMADVRTNVIVNDEYTFITDLSYNLSNRYQRPESSILVTITHSACLLLGGSFDPAYTLTISALPSQVQPITNKRNAALLAHVLEESLGVSPSRGLIKFIGIPEDNFAFNGKTISAEIEELEKELGEEHMHIMNRRSSRSSTKAAKRQSMRGMKNLKAGIMGGHRDSEVKEPLFPHSDRYDRLTPPLSEENTPPIPSIPENPIVTAMPPMPPMPEVSTEQSAMSWRAEKVRKMSKRKSFIQGLFGKEK